MVYDILQNMFTFFNGIIIAWTETELFTMKRDTVLLENE